MLIKAENRVGEHEQKGYVRTVLVEHIWPENNLLTAHNVLVQR